MNNKSIAIIGAGVAGLTLAHRLLSEGIHVTLYEYSQEVGGQLCALPIEGILTEMYYHHTFMSDTQFIDLCEELGIDDKLFWFDASMAYYTGGKQYRFSTAIDLLKFNPLGCRDKLKFAVSILKLQSIKDMSQVEHYSAKNWFVNQGYGKVWKVIWEPLFRLKFADRADHISLVWLWDKLIKRGKSRKGTKEKLCYMEGSFFQFAKALKTSIENKNGLIKTSTRVSSISKPEDKFILTTADGDVTEFDKVVSTLSTTNHAKLAGNLIDMSITERYQYQAAICVVFILNQKFSDYYWTNIGDFDLPFGGVIEHTNFVGRDKYNGKSIVYLSRYLNERDGFYSLSKEDIKKQFIQGLKSMNCDFREENIIDSYVFKQPDAQPVVKVGYVKPSIETETDGLYWISTHHVYPHDRGIEYGIEQAKILSKLILSEN